VPNATLFGVLADPTVSATPSMIASLHAAARTLHLQVVVANARTDSDLETAFASFSQQRVGAVLVSPTNFSYNRRMEQLAALAASHALPAIFPRRDWALVGGLMSYGYSFDTANHQLGMYVGRILKGEKPADLPVTQPTKFELTINLKTAKALGLAGLGSAVAWPVVAGAQQAASVCQHHDH
jgi:putative ABC transport system substrate-binding protein